MRRRIFPVAAACVAACVAAAAPGAARADVTYTFVTPAGSTTSGPVNDQVVFVVGSGVNVPVGTIQITLTNLQANPGDVGQNLSDLSFTLANGTTTGASLASSAAQEVTVNSDKTFTLGVGTVATGWVFSTTGGGTGATLDDLAGVGHAGPAHTIIGPPGGGTYSNANGSLTNGAHNPFLNQTATFTITGSGITANTQVTGATFSFGTTAGVNINGVAAVPEPGTFLMGGLIAGAFVVSGVRRAAARRKA